MRFNNVAKLLASNSGQQAFLSRLVIVAPDAVYRTSFVLGVPVTRALSTLVVQLVLWGLCEPLCKRARKPNKSKSTFTTCGLEALRHW
ncbi:hypothetical protein VTO42DRAFT_1090 [Malbranchea cinnamomea]